MPVILYYILKLTISLGVVYLFYHLVLRRLTFYNWNRWYLVTYTIFCFFIPFIDIDPFLHHNQLTDATIVQIIPLLNEQISDHSNNSIGFTGWDFLILSILTGLIVMVIRLLIQFISFRRLLKKATLISEKELKVYQVNDSIIPFSFGKAVFINRELHTPEELEEIIRHEFIHVKQNHSIDIIWGEILCVLNWFNPFAWTLKKSIRQNLEFIADNKVLQNGINKKDYQYLLLKVIGSTQFSIANQFNFSSLKKRIAMMNKTKSARRQLLRMLFLLPATAVLLLAFRNKFHESDEFSKHQQSPFIDQDVVDTIPEQTKPNEKGYFIDVKDKEGECLLVIKDRDRKEVKRMLLTDWNEKPEHFEKIYGSIPPPPEKDELNEVIVLGQPTNQSTVTEFLVTGHPSSTIISRNGETADLIVTGLPVSGISTTGNGLNEVIVKGRSISKIDTLPKNIKNIESNDKKVTVTLKNGEKEVYDMSSEKDKTAFENKYGLSVYTIDSKNISTYTTSNSPVIATGVNGKMYTTNGADVILASPATVGTTNSISTVYPNASTGKSGTTISKVYSSDVAVASPSGKLYSAGSSANVILASPATVGTTNSVSTVYPNVATVATGSTISNTYSSDVAIASPSGKLYGTRNSDVIVSGQPLFHGAVDIEITISKNTKPEELEAIVKKMKEKGYELKFTNKNYNDGVLNQLSGTINYKDDNASFNVSGFDKVTIISFRDGDKVIFKVFTGPKKVVT